MDDTDDLAIAVTHAGVVGTDENLPMSLDLVALLDDGCGELLAEEMEARGLTPDQVALASGLGRATLDAIIASREAVTEDMSRAISRGLGAPFISDDFWAQLDANIRREKARLA